MTERVKARLDLPQLAADFSAETAIESELCNISVAWARDMVMAFHASPPSSLNKDYFNQLLEETGNRIAILPRDADGIPIFRTRYATTEMFYKLIAAQYPDARMLIEGTPLKITVHYDRIDKVCQTLMQIQRDKGYPYDSVTAEVPNRSENMPSKEVLPRGTEQHAQFLWHVCYWMGGGIESNLAFKYLGQMYADHPELFDPRYVVEQNLTEEDIDDIISQYPALRFNHQRIKNYWITNAHKMVRQYDGDVRAVFDGAQSYRTVTERLVNKRCRGFKGFQEKMASMYTHFLADAEIIEEIPFPPPVDFHLLRLAESLGMMTFENPGRRGTFGKKTIATLRKALYDYIIVTGTSELELDDALWRYSKLICSKAPGNASTIDYTARRGDNVTEGEVDFSDKATMKRWSESCGRCALSDRCEFSISSGKYYYGDKIESKKRVKEEPEHKALVPFVNDMLRPPQSPQQSTGTLGRIATFVAWDHPMLEI